LNGRNHRWQRDDTPAVGPVQRASAILEGHRNGGFGGLTGPARRR
jgi:hypothetical protein